MGICISKCRHPNPPLDKPVVSRSLCIRSSAHLPRGQQTSSSTSCSSCSSSSSATLAASSSCVSSSSASLFGVASHIVVLHPGNGKQTPPERKAAKFSARGSRTRPQRPTRGRTNSPALERQKSIISSTKQGSVFPSRRQSQHSPCGSARVKQTKEARKSVSPSRALSFAGIEIPRRELASRHLDLRPRPLTVSAKVRPQRSGPLAPTIHHRRLKRRETSVDPIPAPEDRQGRPKMFHSLEKGSNHRDDVNNPLISLDCFIFL